MSELFKWLSENHIATVALILAVLSIVAIYLIAFFQGREISFWPPKIGPKPNKAENEELNENPESNQPTNFGPLIQKGSIIAASSSQKYTIESNFYSGAASTLFKAKSHTQDRVIIKVYWRGLRPGSSAWEMFNREYRVAEILTHRNIVRILDRGLSAGYPFVVMEYLPGGTLRDLLQSRNYIPGADILSISGQIADAIDFAHSHGVIHRDIKPGNVLFESDPHGRVALSDFGIAQILGAVEWDITAAEGEFIGSPGYLAPETLRGVNANKASDIYSFGVLLFEMIAGTIPFNQFQPVYALLQEKAMENAPNICKFRAVPEAIANRISKTLSRDPQERPQAARAVLSGIETELSQL